jgi:hypothetical protein
MASPKISRLLACLILFGISAQAQTIQYPADASTLLRSTASDMAELLSRATPSSPVQASAYNALPASGIVLLYNDSIADNQACRVRSNGSSCLIFEAAEDNGLVFGIYRYLHFLGYRFWQPGTNWENIPNLSNPYRNIDTVFTCRFKYKTWFLSGGHNKWAMDNDATYDWDTYFGRNGHAWALYQRRNGMLGAHRFTGHRGDLMGGAFLDTLKNNRCLVAPYNGSRLAVVQSVPDVNNPGAMDLWSKTVSGQYLQYRQTILNNKALYPDLYRSFRYNQGNIGIEVPDGAQWANTRDASPCSGGELYSESNQQFILANHTVNDMRRLLPAMRYQLYAYDTHADVPSPEHWPSRQIDVQVIPSAFQFETSTRGLLNRWYGKNVSISEYHYMNIAQWSGETPSFRLEELKNTLERLSNNNTQGIVWEAAPSKFATLPYLLAANNFLLNKVPVDSTLNDFCRSMFGNAHQVVYQLLQDWGSADVVNLSNGIQDNKYKIPHYLRQVQTAEALLQNGSPAEQQRLRELKAFLRYMTLYYNWLFEQSNDGRKEKLASSLCRYLARASSLKLVNSYALINMVVQPYGETHPLFLQYNTTNGTAYMQGSLPGLSDAEIDRDFREDCARHLAAIDKYSFNTVEETAAAMDRHGMQPLETISFNIGYTQGKNYTQRSEIFIYATKAGSFTVRYTPRFDMPDKGSINITVEENNSALGILTDYTIGRNRGEGTLTVHLPAAGIYKMSVVSKFQAAVSLSIATGGNYFFRHDAFLGNTVENYRANPESLPGYIYVPSGISNLYFSLNNSNPAGMGHAGASVVNEIFRFSGPDSVLLTAQPTPGGDSALFSIPLTSNTGGMFIRAGKMEQYRLCLANVSNFYWYARKKECCARENSTGKLSVYPNPSRGLFRFSSSGESAIAASVQVFSSSAQLLHTQYRTATIDIRHLPSGIYFYRASVGGKTSAGKLIKN